MFGQLVVSCVAIVGGVASIDLSDAALTAASPQDSYDSQSMGMAQLGSQVEPTPLIPEIEALLAQTEAESMQIDDDENGEKLKELAAKL